MLILQKGFESNHRVKSIFQVSSDLYVTQPPQNSWALPEAFTHQG